MKFKGNLLSLLLFAAAMTTYAQTSQKIKLVKSPNKKRIDVYAGDKPFTSFIYPDSLEKPVLYPVRDAAGVSVTRGFPLEPRPGEPTDHPHHMGIWFTYENVNGLDFWNNSYAIAQDKKHLYGWVRTDRILETTNGTTGKLVYHANWTNQKKEVLLDETTRYQFSAAGNQRIIDRFTTLKAVKEVTFTDAKDGLLGLRLAHELQIPATEDQKFTDNKGNVTVVKGGTDKVANGTYLTSEGKRGNEAWSTRGKWCKVYGKIGTDSVCIAIIDHRDNPNYPTFWHARGYGLFAANPLGEKIFTNGKSAKNLHLNPGDKVTFRYRIVIENGSTTLSKHELDEMAEAFSKVY